MPHWSDAVEEGSAGVRLLLEVSAGSKVAAFPAGYNPWRNRIGIKVRAPAQEGRANQEILRDIAAFFGVPAAQVQMEAGHLDSRKSVRVVGIDRAAVLDRLQSFLEEGP